MGDVEEEAVKIDVTEFMQTGQTIVTDTWMAEIVASELSTTSSDTCDGNIGKGA